VTNPNDQFERLEEKLMKAIELFKRTQMEKRELQQAIDRLKSETEERVHGASAMERELIALRREREEVRLRLEKLLERIDAVMSPDSNGGGQ
jgi:FtsZ-binding cell division protein ZapB